VLLREHQRDHLGVQHRARAGNDEVDAGRHEHARADLEHRRAEGAAVSARNVFFGQPDGEGDRVLVVANGPSGKGRLADPRGKFDDQARALLSRSVF
jgi:hypothetical protein